METLYYNGDILTMEEGTAAEAVLVKNGTIAAVGSLQDILCAASDKVQQIDLRGHTLMPAFLDAHSHITALAQTIRLAALSTASTMEELIALLKRQKEKLRLSPGEWLIGFGYDHTHLPRQQHPDKAFLDRAFPENPVAITHASGHMGVMNSAALKKLGVTKDTQDPDGGKIGRMKDGKEPNGYLEENAFFSYSAGIPTPSLSEQCDLMEQAQEIYLQHGICTAQEGKMDEAQATLLTHLAETERLRMDVVGFIDLKNAPGLAATNTPYLKQYHNHFKIGGYKIFLDGSPQGKTAWLTKPYENSGGDCGYPVHSTEQIKKFASKALQEDMQLLAHCNGDAAAQQYLDGFSAALQENEKKAAIRPVMIHAQLLRPDQLPYLKALSMIPSYFVAHTFYWGDTHIKNLGIKRASQISPACSAQDLGIPFTFHQDSPVLPPDMLETVWCAVNRITKDGMILEGQQISPYEALKAVTIHAAYQYFEQEKKGSIKKGKEANLIILDQNPCKTPPMKIKSIRILETILRGDTVYKK